VPPYLNMGPKAVKGFLVGTVVATLLLAAQDGGHPLREAGWVFVGTTLTALTEAYGAHISRHRDQGGPGYVGGLARNVAEVWSEIAACLPTVVLLLAAAVFGWHDDHRNPDGTGSVGYTTVLLNINVVLLFVWSAVAARRGGHSWPQTVLLGLVGFGLGLLIIRIELALTG
jgi:hypothetical protein